jgi:hypothetical protein
MAKKRKINLINYFTEPVHLFYLGFLASVGLAFGSAMIINLLRQIVEHFLDFEILIYSRIIFSIFYLSFIMYTYSFLDMKKNVSLRNGFLLFTILFILAQIYIWIIS